MIDTHNELECFYIEEYEMDGNFGFYICVSSTKGYIWSNDDSNDKLLPLNYIPCSILTDMVE